MAVWVLALCFAFPGLTSVAKSAQSLAQPLAYRVASVSRVLRQSTSPQQFTSFLMDLGNKKRPPPTVKLSKWPLAVNPSEKFVV